MSYNTLKHFLESVNKHGRNIIGNDGLKREIKEIKICFDNGIEVVHTELKNKDDDNGDHYVKLDYNVDQIISSCTFIADDLPVKEVCSELSEKERQRQKIQSLNSRVQYYKDFILPKAFKAYNDLLQLRKQELLIIKKRPMLTLIKEGTRTYVDSSDLWLSKKNLKNAISDFKKCKEELQKAQKEYREANNEN